MKTYTVKYNFNIYKPNNIDLYNQQKQFEVIVQANDLLQAKAYFRLEHNKNPAYFLFIENV